MTAIGQATSAGQSSVTVIVTSMLPRVALEYGHTLWALSANASSLGLDEVREGDLEFDGELEAALIVLADAHAGADRGVLDIRLGLARHQAQRRVKAGRVADREELLGIRAVAAAAHLRGGGEIDVDLPVARAAVAVAAFAGGQCFCCVESPA
jgi:hypothetical protein